MIAAPFDLTLFAFSLIGHDLTEQRDLRIVQRFLLHLLVEVIDITLGAAAKHGIVGQLTEAVFDADGKICKQNTAFVIRVFGNGIENVGQTAERTGCDRLVIQRLIDQQNDIFADHDEVVELTAGVQIFNTVEVDVIFLVFLRCHRRDIDDLVEITVDHAVIIVVCGIIRDIIRLICRFIN